MDRSDGCRSRSLLIVCGALASLLPGPAGCGSSAPTADGGDDAAEHDAVPDEGTPEDAGGEADAVVDDSGTEIMGDGFVLDAAGWEGSEYVVLPPASACGDGVVDPGEECDDWNRLNGDGCDWLCRVGDGDPPPDPDPDTTDYVPSGDGVSLPGASARAPSFERVPLVWTDSEFATAWWQPPEVEGEAGLIRFWRFDASGRRLDAEWRMPSVLNYGGLEVVWTGSGFGLFFVDLDTGLWFLRLDATGKPIGLPVLIEGDPKARAPAADVARDGTLVVAWVSEPRASGWGWCSVETLPHPIRVRRIDLDGRILGPVLTVEEAAQGPPDVATGEGGFGLAIPTTVDLPDSYCAFRFLRLDEALEHATHSGVLGGTMWGDVKWLAAESRWVTSWASSLGTPEEPREQIHVAFFAADGTLAGPPVRNAVSGVEHLDRPVRLAAGDGGLVLVTAWRADRQLSYLRTDRRGTAIAPLRDVLTPTTLFASFGPYNTVWSDDGFAVLFDFEDRDRGESGLYLRRFVRAE